MSLVLGVFLMPCLNVFGASIICIDSYALLSEWCSGCFLYATILDLSVIIFIRFLTLQFIAQGVSITSITTAP
jgi:hypothetical protein